MRMSLAVLIQYARMTDGVTDGHRPTAASTALPVLFLLTYYYHVVILSAERFVYVQASCDRRDPCV